MNTLLIITAALTKVERKNYLDKSGAQKEFLTCSIPYKSDVVKDANGNDVRNTSYASFILTLNAFTQNLKKGDIVQVSGEPEISIYNGQKGAAAELKIKNVNVKKILSADRVVPYQAGVPQYNQAPAAQTAPVNAGYNPTMPNAGYNPAGIPGQTYNPVVPTQGYNPAGVPGQTYNPATQAQGFNNQGGFVMPTVDDEDLPF